MTTLKTTLLRPRRRRRNEVLGEKEKRHKLRLLPRRLNLNEKPFLPNWPMLPNLSLGIYPRLIRPESILDLLNSSHLSAPPTHRLQSPKLHKRIDRNGGGRNCLFHPHRIILNSLLLLNESPNGKRVVKMLKVDSEIGLLLPKCKMIIGYSLLVDLSLNILLR
jgi:hypothetical protein